MIGPHNHVNGSIEADESFIATSASVFSGGRIGQRPRSESMAAVQVNSVPELGDVVPIRWVAVGPPAFFSRRNVMRRSGRSRRSSSSAKRFTEWDAMGRWLSSCVGSQSTSAPT